MKINQLFLILLTIIIMGGCGSKKNSKYDSVSQMISIAQKEVDKIEVKELKTLLDHKGENLLIDCREKEEFIEGHIPGAINIPRGLLEFSSKISNRRETIYVYSQTNDRASLACPNLKLLKYKRVYLVDGGWLEWNKSFPSLVEKGDDEKGNKPAPKVEVSSGCGG